MELLGLFELWVDSPLKVQIVSFFHRNPGIIEPVEGLANRMGLDVEQVRKTVADHVRLGLLRRRKLGDKEVILYDRVAEQKIQELVAQRMRSRTGAAV